MQSIQEAPVTEKGPELKIDINENLGESLQNGFDAIGQVFGGLVGAVKDTVGPDLMKTLEVANWLGQLGECLEKVSKGLTADGVVPAEPTGQLAFFAEQFDSTLDGSKLESQKSKLQQHLQNCQQAVENAGADPVSAAVTLSHSAGYFKAAAGSCIPVQAKASGENSPEVTDE